MAKEKGYETYQDVIDAHKDWEQKQEAEQLGYDLWETAEEKVKEKNSDARRYEKDKLATAVFWELKNAGYLSICLTDTLRENVVRLHARGVSTTEIVEDILSDEQWEQITPFYTFKFRNVCGYENIKKFMVSRLGYLKKSHQRFPKKKFGDIWTEERERFLQTLNDIPLATPAEQLHELTGHYQKLKGLFDESVESKDKERYHNCMMKTLAAIHLIGRDANAHMPHAITQEKNPKALPTPNNEDVLEISVQNVDIVNTS